MAKKSRGRREAVMPGYYHVEITSWDWDYSFSVNAARREDTRFADYRLLVVHGAVLRPRKIKVETAELNFFPELIEQERRFDEPPPDRVGSLDARHGRLTGYFSMPVDVLGPVMQMLIAGRYKYVLMHGEPMRYRNAAISGYRFVMTHEEADFPDDP